MKKKICTCLLFCTITLLLPLLLTYLFSRHSSLQDYPDVSDLRIYTDDSTSIPLSLEDYVTGLLIANVPIHSEMETLKAQAVILRTYAIKNMMICDQMRSNQSLSETLNPHSKGYTINELGLSYMSPDSYYKSIDVNNYETALLNIRNAIKQTAGEILTYDKQIITPLFFSTSAGKTRNSYEVWSEPIPYLTSVDSNQDMESPEFLKVSIFTIDSTIQLLQTAFQNHLLEYPEYDNQVYDHLPVNSTNFFDSLNIIKRDSAGYVLTIGISDILVTGDSFAKALGLSSPHFYYEEYEDSIRFISNGSGHGFGFSQYGANVLAQKSSYNYKELLDYYYTDVDIIKL